MTGKPVPEAASDRAGASDEIAELTRQVEQLKEERDYLLAHSANLEAQLRDVARDPARIRDLETRLAGAEALVRHVSVVHTSRWLLLQPKGALRRVYRLLRDGVLWRARERYRRLRLKLRG